MRWRRDLLIRGFRAGWRESARDGRAMRSGAVAGMVLGLVICLTLIVT